MDTFNPVKYSREENEFLLENVGRPPVIVQNEMEGKALVGINPRAVRPILQEIYDREQLKAVRNLDWIGLEAVKEAIRTYLTVDAKWESDWLNSRGRVPRLPTLFVRDGKGKYFYGASGSDSDYPRTWEDKSGKRHRFEVNLGGEAGIEFDEIMPAPDALIHEEDKRRFECPICRHTESYKADSRSSFNAARARMSKHLKRPSTEESMHRELYTKEFGG